MNYMPNTPIQLSKFIVNRFTCVVTGTYNDMTQKPYRTDCRADIINNFQEITNGGTAIGEYNVAAVANQFFKPDMQLQTPSVIENGWSESRLRFILDVEEFSELSQSGVRRIVQGYTDYCGFSPTGFVDPQMEMFINSILTLRTVERFNGVSTQPVISAVNSNQILRGSNEVSLQDPNNTMWLMRPEDMLNAMAVNAVLQGENVYNYTCIAHGSPIRPNDRKNDIASSYMTKLIKGIVATSNDYHTQLNEYGTTDRYTAATSYLQETTLNLDKFLSYLISNSENFSRRGCFTYGEFCSLFPGIDEKVEIIDSKSVTVVGSQYPQSVRGNSEYWNNSTIETLWATVLAQSLPSLMTDLLVSQLAFTATNRTLDGQVYMEYGLARSFVTDLDLTPFLEKLRLRLIGEVLLALSNNNLIDFFLSIRMSVTGDSHLTVSVAGNPPVDYIAPSFTDSLYAPTATTNYALFNSNSVDMSVLVNHLDRCQVPTLTITGV